MAFPITNYTRVWVRGRIVDLAKAAREEASYGVTGPVQFIPSPDVVVDRGTDQIIDMKPFVVFPRASDGFFEIQLPATDDPDVNPGGWTYHVIEPTGRDYNIVIPSATPAVTTPGDPRFGEQVIDLSDVVPNPEANPGTIQTLAGIPGRGIATVTVDGSGNLIGTYSDGTSWSAGFLPVRSVAGRTGVITLTKSDVGLGSVDNTSDAAKPVSTATATALAGKASTSHTHPASDIVSGQLGTDRMPQVSSTVRAATGTSGTVTPNAAAVGNNLDYTATGNVVFAAPTGGANRQVLRLAVLASGADRTVTFDAAIRVTTGVNRGPYSVPSGQALLAGIEFSSLLNAWVLAAATVTAA